MRANERSLNSLLRRCFIWMIKSRFEDAQSIAAAYGDIAKDAVFSGGASKVSQRQSEKSRMILLGSRKNGETCPTD